MKKMFRRTRICSKCLGRSKTEILVLRRLRTENRELLHEIKDLSRIIDTGYKQLVCDRTGLNERQDLPEGIRRMAARIQELEDAHKRSGVKYAKIINELRSSVYANTPGLKKQWDEILNTPAEAIRQLDVKPRSWKITDEREEALHVMGNMKTLIVCPHCKTPIEFVDIPKYTAVLRAMLEEVSSNV